MGCAGGLFLTALVLAGSANVDRTVGWSGRAGDGYGLSRDEAVKHGLIARKPD
jgi:hypothetical protein